MAGSHRTTKLESVVASVIISVRAAARVSLPFSTRAGLPPDRVHLVAVRAARTLTSPSARTVSLGVASARAPAKISGSSVVAETTSADAIVYSAVFGRTSSYNLFIFSVLFFSLSKFARLYFPSVSCSEVLLFYGKFCFRFFLFILRTSRRSSSGFRFCCRIIRRPDDGISSGVKMFKKEKPMMSVSAIIQSRAAHHWGRGKPRKKIFFNFTLHGSGAKNGQSRHLWWSVENGKNVFGFARSRPTDNSIFVLKYTHGFLEKKIYIYIQLYT